MHQNELKHFGVKGMKWGVRNEEGPGGNRSKPPKNLAAKNKAQAKELKKKLEAKGVDEVALKHDYDGRGNFLQRHKKEIAIGVGVVSAAAVVGGAYYLKKKGYLSKPLQVSLEENWTKPINLPAGTVFSRVSSVAEKKPRPGGFYAAFDQGDVLRYRAGLAAVLGETPKFHNEYTATTRVKAPSGFQTLSSMKELARKNPDFARRILSRQAEADRAFNAAVPAGVPKRAVVEASTSLRKVSESHWQTVLQTQSRIWSLHPDDPETTTFFAHLRERGYNAVIDFNNSGVLARVPVRTIDGSAFRVTASKVITETDLAEALEFCRTDDF